MEELTTAQRSQSVHNILSGPFLTACRALRNPMLYHDLNEEHGAELVIDDASKLTIPSDFMANAPDASDMQAIMLAYEDELWTLMSQYGYTMQNMEEEAMKLKDAANTLILQYQQSGSMEILNEAICLLRQTSSVFPDDHPSHVESLMDLAKAIGIRYQEIDDKDALAECISLNRNALALLPLEHPDRGKALNNLGIAIRLHYEHSGNSASLTECISVNRNALALRPQGHPLRGSSLTNLASGLRIYYNQSGDMDALAECIDLNRDALALAPRGHPDRGSLLTNLASGLMIYHDENGDMDTLAECITLNRDALALFPQGHPHHGISLHNLATTLNKHYKQSGDMEALAECISLNHNALLYFPQGHPQHGASLLSLANVLRVYYKQSSDMDALAESINVYYGTLEIWRKGHPGRGDSLYGLSKAYNRQFELNSNNQALQSALHYAQEILDVAPLGHPLCHRVYHLIARIRLNDSPYHSLEEALGCLHSAITYTHVLPRQRLKSAIKTLRSFEQAFIRRPEELHRVQQLLDLYLSTVELLPLAANYGLTNTIRLRELSMSGELCRPASICAIKCNQLRLAVQLHEEGKAVFWSQALRLRSSALDALLPDDRETLRRLFRQLEHDSASFSEELDDKVDLERRVEHRRQLNKQAEKLIENIRRRPGFDRFLKIPLYEQLKNAASTGFIVVLVSYQANCFAIVVHADDSPRCITLDTLKDSALHSLCKSTSESGMRDYEQGLPSSYGEKETARAMNVRRHQAYSPLAEMWHAIVKPVVDTLGLQQAKGRDRPRVHWCPSGELALLPLHAAGIYQRKNKADICAANYIVSSYTPSISTLLTAREGFAPIPCSKLHAALYADSGGHSGSTKIFKVFEEVDVAARILTEKSAVVNNHMHGCSTSTSVLEGAAGAHVLHLSCHGLQHENPLESHFVLKDRPLTISDLMSLNLKNAVLAYLSACYTARGDKNQPDQAVHLAASMLFCGFRSVVATMWTMYDKDGPKMAEWFYEALLEKETISLDDIPYALDVAVTQLRKEGAPAWHWATYMHLGA